VYGVYCWGNVAFSQMYVVVGAVATGGAVQDDICRCGGRANECGYCDAYAGIDLCNVSLRKWNRMLNR
jgi:hypothetical protein